MLATIGSAAVRGGRAVASGAAVRSASTAGVTFDRRRMQDRKGWRIAPDDDADLFVFPRERLGNQLELNWAINKYQIIPQHDAYRNLHTRGLQMLSKSKADKQKRVCVEVDAPATHETYFLEPAATEEGAAATPLPAGAKTISFEQFRYIFRDLRKHLSFTEEIFVHDGAVGSSSAAEVPTRCFLDNAAHALFLKHMMNRVPFRKPLNFEEKAQLFVASGLSLDASYGLPKNFTIIDMANNRAIVCGNPASTPIRDGLIAAAAPLLAKESGALAVAAHTVFVGDKSALVFADANSAAPTGVEQYSAAHSIWGPNGLSRAWNGITSAPAANAGTRGDLLETMGSSKLLTCTLPNSRGAAVAHPSAAIFVSAKAKGVKPLDTKQAVEQFKAAGQVPGSSLEAFTALMEANKVKAFAVGAGDASKGITAAVLGK